MKTNADFAITREARITATPRPDSLGVNRDGTAHLYTLDHWTITSMAPGGGVTTIGTFSRTSAEKVMREVLPAFAMVFIETGEAIQVTRARMTLEAYTRAEIDDDDST